MTAFQVYHMCREHGEGPSKLGGVEGASVNVWGSMEYGGRTPQKKENIQLILDKNKENDTNNFENIYFENSKEKVILRQTLKIYKL